MIIESETTKGKKYAIITKAGYIYNADKSKKTDSKDEAAEWYDCAKENLILIPGYHAYSCYTVLEIKRDPNIGEGETPNRVLLNYYGIKFARAKETRQPLFCYLGYIWLYNDGRVIESWLSKEDRSFIDSGVPKRIRRITSPNPQDLKLITDYYWFLGLPTTWGILHSNNSIDTLGSLSKEEIDLLKEAGFKKDYFCNTRGSKISLMEKSTLYISDLINFARWSVSSIAKTSKEIKKQESLLPEMDPKCIIQVDSIKEDTIIRINRTNFSYIINNNSKEPQDGLWGMNRGDKFSFKINEIGEETYRIYIKKNGYLSLYVRSGEEWISTRSVYDFCGNDVFNVAYSFGLIKGSLMNLFDNNSKLKYFKDFYHRNYKKIFRFDDYDEESKNFNYFNQKTNAYHKVDLISRLKDLLKILQAYPAFCDTLDKLGHLDYLFYDSFGEFDSNHFLEVLSDSRYESLNSFFFKQKARTLLDTMGINRYQWRTFLAQIKRDLEANGFNDKETIVPPDNENFLKIRKIIVNNYKLWNYLQKFFVNTLGKKYNWVDAEPYYSFLKEIPDNEFDSFIGINNKIDNLITESDQNMSRFFLAVSGNSSYYRNRDEYSFSWLNYILDCSYSLIGNSFSWPTGEKVSIERFSLLKVAKENYKNNLSATLYRDYLRLRENCARYGTAEDGFDINDWPLKVKATELQSFHDRLSLIDAEIRRMTADKRAARENAIYQEKWENRIKKEKLNKFVYAPKDGDRCILVPMKIVPELIFEGQKLQHCVGSYVSSVADGKETILFLRKRDNLGTPYATIDIAYNSAIKLWEVRQAHTYRNGPITEEDKNFLIEWGEERGISKESIRTNYGALCHL